MSAAEFSALADTITAIATVAAVTMAYRQVRQINRTLKQSTVQVMLEIDDEISRREQVMVDAALKCRLLSKEPDDHAEKDQAHRQLEVARESYFNALDRLCFCIRRKYLISKDWKEQYDYHLEQILTRYAHDFGPGTNYNNVREVARLWKLYLPTGNEPQATC